MPFRSRIIRRTVATIVQAAALTVYCSFAESSPTNIGISAAYAMTLGTIFFGTWLTLLAQFVFNKPVTGNVLSRHNSHRWRNAEDQRYWLVVKRPVVGRLNTHLSVPVSYELFWKNQPGYPYTDDIPVQY